MYKVIYNNMIIDILEQPEYLRHIKRQKRNLATDPTSANGVSASDGHTVYHVEGMPPFPKEYAYKTVKLVEIDEDEYNSLQSQLVSGVAVVLEDPAVEPEHEPMSLLEMQEKLQLLEKQVNELLQMSKSGHNIKHSR